MGSNRFLRMVKSRSEADLAPVEAHPLMQERIVPRMGVKVAQRKDLTRFVRWPEYIRIQRQKQVLMKRLKTPPAIAQFSATIDKNQANELMKVLNGMKPEAKVVRRNRMREEAKMRAENKKGFKSKAPIQVQTGLKKVVSKIEKGEAKIVVIAADVDPIEQVVFIPTLCRKFNIPFCFVKSRALLGQIAGVKTCSTVCITDVKPEFEGSVKTLADQFKTQFNDNVELRRSWGGTIMSNSYYEKKAAQARLAKQN